MADSILDNKPSHVLNFPLTLKQQVWLQFITPGVITSVLYITTIAADVAVGIGLLLERQITAGLVTLTLVYVPALVCFVLELTSFSVSKPWTVKSVVSWFLKELMLFIIFPLRTLQSLGELIFWLVEAAHSKGDLETSLAGTQTALPRSVHVYLFLQPFLQCAPQAILQLHLLLLKVSTEPSTERVQILCIFCSITTLALSVAFYHRYESQCLAGRPSVLQNRSYEEIIKRDNDTLTGLDQDDPAGTTVVFFSWFFFLLARILSLVFSSYFHLYITLLIISIHYIIMFVYFLTLKSSNFLKKLCLSYIAIFSLVEVSIKFNRLGILHFLFFITCLSENVGLTIYWFVFSAWSEWWLYYVAYIVIVAHVLSIILFIIYSLVFYPNTVRKPLSTAV